MAAKRGLNRRDFLSLRRTPQGRTIELSCQALYVQFVDAEATDGSAGVTPAQAALIARIEEDLRDVDRLRLLESGWLSSSPLGERMAPVLDSFCARGGRIEFAKTSV